jgi:repressor LexA
MNDFKTRLKEAMDLRGIRATTLAAESGVSKARISQYLHGIYVPKTDAVLSLAAVLGVSEGWLLGKEGVPMLPADTPIQNTSALPFPDNLSPLHLRRYPVLGEIACGQPIIAEQDNDGGYVTAADTHADFCLTAKGDSMIGARIFDGDEVFIRRADMVNNGEIAAVIVDNEATLKRVFYYPDEGRLVLAPENPDYEPLEFVGEELREIRILGKAVAFQSKLS